MIKSIKEKTIYKLCAIIFCTLFIAACSDDDMDPYFSVSQKTFQLNYQGLVVDKTNTFDASFELGSNNSWRVKSKSDWLTLSHTSGEKGRYRLFISATETGIEEDREGSIVLESGNFTETIKVTQLRKEETLTVSPSKIEVNIVGQNAEGKSPSLTLITNSNWTLTCDDWIKPELTSGGPGTFSIGVAIGTNTTNEIKNGSITIQAGEITTTIDVKQTLGGLTVNTTELSANYKAEFIDSDGTFKITSATSWTIEADSWITLNTTSGQVGETIVTATLEENNATVKRTGKITINGEYGLKAVIKVSQSGNLPDDGKAVGFQYYFDDFAWCSEFGGDDQVANPVTYSTVRINKDEATKTAFESRYADYNPSIVQIYLAKHYLKFNNKKANYTGIVASKIPNLEEGKASNITLSFDGSPNVGLNSDKSAGDITKQDKVKVIVKIVDGPGSIEVNDETTKTGTAKPISISSIGDWVNINHVLYGVTSKTKILITTDDITSDQRWFLDNIKIVKHSVYVP